MGGPGPRQDGLSLIQELRPEAFVVDAGFQDEAAQGGGAIGGGGGIVAGHEALVEGKLVAVLVAAVANEVDEAGGADGGFSPEADHQFVTQQRCGLALAEPTFEFGATGRQDAVGAFAAPPRFLGQGFDLASRLKPGEFPVDRKEAVPLNWT